MIFAKYLPIIISLLAHQRDKNATLSMSKFAILSMSKSAIQSMNNSATLFMIQSLNSNAAQLMSKFATL